MPRLQLRKSLDSQAGKQDQWPLLFQQAPYATTLEFLAAEDIFDRLPHHLSTNIGDRLGERNIFGTNFYAVLSVTAFLDAAIAHQRLQAVHFLSLAGGMSVEQPHLRDGGCAHESGLVVELRTGFHAAAAGDAARQRIRFFLLLCRLPWAGAKVVGAIDRNPGFHLL